MKMEKLQSKLSGFELFCIKEGALITNLYAKIEDTFYQVHNGEIDFSTGMTKDQAENDYYYSQCKEIMEQLKTNLFFAQKGEARRKEAKQLAIKLAEKLTEWIEQTE